MYFGSVRFFKDLIIVCIATIIAVSIGLAVFFGVKYASLKNDYEENISKPVINNIAEEEKEEEVEYSDEVKELLVNHKWYYTIFDGISALYSTTSHNMANRISELANRYESTLPSLEKDVEDYEAKVKSHLERMGFSW